MRKTATFLNKDVLDTIMEIESNKITEYDDNLKQTINEELDKGDSDFKKVLNQYPKLEFIHVWEKKPDKIKTYINSVFFDYEKSQKYIDDCLELNQNRKFAHGFGTVEKLINKSIKEPFDGRQIKNKEIHQIYNALKQIIVE